MKNILLLFLLTSCVPGMHLLTVSRQKQKVEVLQRKLELAERERYKVDDLIAILQHELYEAELEYVRRKIDKAPSELDVSQNFFEEREMLHDLIQNAPPSIAFQAESELDRILRLITELSDR